MLGLNDRNINIADLAIINTAVKYRYKLTFELSEYVHSMTDKAHALENLCVVKLGLEYSFIMFHTVS